MTSSVSRLCLMSLFLLTYVTLSNGQAAITNIVAPIRTEYITREGFFPLWWSEASYVGGAIVLGYTFFGLLALYAYRNWVYDDTVGYRSFQDNLLKPGDFNLDELIKSFGENWKLNE